MQAQRFDGFLDTVCSGIFSDRLRGNVRRELLDHLTCSYEEAVAQGLDEAAAAEKAVGSFGERDKVREEITRAHQKDNLKTVGKGFGCFLISLLAAALVLLAQCFIAFFWNNIVIFLIGFLFVALTGTSLYAARRKQILLPICLIPAALAQIFAFARVPSFLITLPVFVSGQLPGFLEDIAYRTTVATPVSAGIMTGFILLYTAVNIWISVSSFRLRSKRPKAIGSNRWAIRIAACLLTVTAAAFVLCFGIGFVPDRIDQKNQYISHYLFIPADSEAEVQEILQYYQNNDIRFDSFFFSKEQMYPTEETAYRVYYHHDLNSAAIDAAAYRDRKEEPQDSTIPVQDTYELSSGNLFYCAYKSVVVLAPEKTAGYYVAIPVIDEYARPLDAEVIALPLEEDKTIYGNMDLYLYEIILKQSR